MPSQFMPSLCAPSQDLLCFGCCPPIRPQHYDPLDYITSLRREYSDNRARFLEHGPHQPPIVGFSCWALGYLEDGLRIGCLLHPELHGGQDLRSVTGYGEKCRRERCLANKSFEALNPAAQGFWLQLANGLGAYYYSSIRANPLFHVLLWGAEILEPLAHQALQWGWDATELLWNAPLWSDRQWSPRGHRYLLRLIWSTDPGRLTREAQQLELRFTKLLERIRALPLAPHGSKDTSEARYVHQLGLQQDYADFIRITLGWHRVVRDQALALRERVEGLVASS